MFVVAVYLLLQDTLIVLLWLAFLVNLQLLIPFLEPEPSWLPTPRLKEKVSMTIVVPLLSYLIYIVSGFQR